MRLRALPADDSDIESCAISAQFSFLQ